MKGNTLKKYANGFTTVNNSIIRSAKLTPKAIGIWVQLLSLPNNWKFSKNGLVKIINAGERSIESGLKELCEADLFYMQKKKPDAFDHNIHYEYFVFESISKEEIDKLREQELKDFPKKDKSLEVQNVPVENLEAQSLEVHNVGLQNVAVQNVPVYKRSNNQSCNNQFSNIKKKVKKKSSFSNLSELISNLDDNRQAILKEWLEYKKSKSQSYTDVGLKKLISTMEDYSNLELKTALDSSISNNYAGLFPKHMNKPKNNFYRADANTSSAAINNIKVIDFGE